VRGCLQGFNAKKRRSGSESLADIDTFITDLRTTGTPVGNALRPMAKRTFISQGD